MGRCRPTVFTLWICLALPLAAIADWYSPAWSHRSEIQVTNSGADALTNYATALTLQSPAFDFSHSTADGADLRITDADGVTPLDFWIQDFDPSAGTAKVWVRIPSLAAGSSHTIFVYYGSPAAVSASNGEATFSAFAGFEQNFEVTSRASTAELGKLTYAPETPTPLITAGAPGEFDHWGFREIGNVLYEPAEPNPARRYKTWYTALGDSLYSSDRISWLGQAVSPDGYNWTKMGMVSSTLHGEDPNVVHFGDTYYLFYEGKTAPVYDNVSLMTSPDGLTWTNYGIVIPPNPNFDWMDRSPSSPSLWIEITPQDTTWYCFFEGKGTGPNRGGGSIGLATSPDGFNFTVYGTQPIIPLGQIGQWDSAAMVPDCIYRENGLYWMIYHGHNGNTPFRAGWAYSSNLINWTKVPSISGNPAICEWEDPQVFWDADGNLTATVCGGTKKISRAYLYRHDPAQWPYGSAWSLETRAGLFGLSNAVAGSLRVSGQSFARSSTSMVSTQRWTNGFEVEMRSRSSNFGNTVYNGISIGSGDLVDMNLGGQGQWEVTVLQGGYACWFQNLAYTARMPQSGGKVILAQWPYAGLANNYTIQRMVYDRTGFLKWYAADTLRVSLRDTVYATNQKRVLISQGEYPDGSGGIEDIDWVFVRQLANSEPNVVIGQEESACYAQVVAPNGGEVWILGDSVDVAWTPVGNGDGTRVELNRNYPNGAWELLADNVTGSSLRILVSGNPSANCRVRAACMTSGPTDLSDGNFSITAPLLPSCGIQVLAPNGGEAYTTGTPVHVQWSSGETGGAVRIELNRNYPLGTWETLADSANNDGIATFVLNGPASPVCRVRVTCLSLNQSDVSDADFVLVEPQEIMTLPSQVTVVNGCDANFNLYVLASMASMHSFNLRFQYNPSAIEFQNVQIVGHSNLMSISDEIAGDTLQLNGQFDSTFTGLDTLARLTFHILTEQNATEYFGFVGGQGSVPSPDSADLVPIAGTYTTLNVDATPPMSPGQVVLRPLNGSLRLDWSAVTHDLAGDTVVAPSYRVYFANFSGVPEYFVGSTFDTTFTDSYAHGMNFGDFPSGQYIVRACKSRP